MKKYVPSLTQRREGHKTQCVAYDPKLTIDGGEICQYPQSANEIPGGNTSLKTYIKD